MAGFFGWLAGSSAEQSKGTAPEVETWEERDRHWQIERAAASECSRAAAEKELAAFTAEDEAEIAAAKSFVPDVRIEKHDAGEFLVYGSTIVPRAFIEQIRVASHGRPPHLMPWFGMMGWTTWSAYRAEDARIDLVMNSGRSVPVQCHREKQEILLAALRKAWAGDEQGC